MKISRLRKGNRVYWNNDKSDKGSVIKIDEDGQVLIKWDRETDESGVYGWFDVKTEHLIDLV